MHPETAGNQPIVGPLCHDVGMNLLHLLINLRQRLVILAGLVRNVVDLDLSEIGLRDLKTLLTG